MKNQIFKTPIMPELLWGFLKENADELETHFIFNKMHYKKAVYTNKIILFINSVVNHKSLDIIAKWCYTMCIVIRKVPNVRSL